MCRPANCKSCGKTTWAGCGNHVDAVMRNVPKSQQCSCDRTAVDASSGSGIFGRLFGR